MNLDQYDDMMGLEFGEYGGLSDIFNTQLLKEAFVASTAGGGAILGATWGVKKLADLLGMEKISDPLLRSSVTSAMTFFIGVASGRMLYDYNREAAIGVVGGLGGLAMANFLDALISKMTGSARMLTALGENDYSPTMYSDDGMRALAALEATSVQATAPAFQGLAGPVVTGERLMGLEAAVVQSETLGDVYPAYLS